MKAPPGPKRPATAVSAAVRQPNAHGGRRLAARERREHNRLQDRLAHIAASVPGLIYSFELSPDGSTRMPFASGALRNIFDLDPADVRETAGPALSLIHADDIAQVMATIAESARTMTPWSSEFRVCPARGDTIWVEAHAVPQREPDGITLWNGFMQNVTGRRQAADELRASQSFLQLIVEHVPARIFWKDRDLRFLGCNTRFARDAGCSQPVDLTGLSDFDLPWKDQAALYRKDDLAVLESGIARLDVEEPQTTPDGDTRWLRTSKVPLRNAQGLTIGVIGLYQDITTARKGAQQLRESERRFSTLLDNVDLASVMRDRDGRITYCNGFLLRLTGWPLEDVTGHPWVARFVPPDLADQESTTLASLLLDQPAARHHESEILTRSGERRRIHWSNSVLRSGAGETIGTASIGEDVTERERGAVSIKRLTRVYALLSGINTLIVRARTSADLFSAVCRVAVDVGAFRMAWIGVVDPVREVVRVVASCGDDAEAYLRGIEVSATTESPLGRGPTGIAVREKRAVWCQNFGGDPRTEPWRESSARFGWGASAAIPLHVKGGTVSVLNLYAAGAEAFDDEERRLLLEMANDIAFAQEHIEQSDRIAYLALHDPLTGLANRTLFVDRVTQYVRSAASGGHKLALLLIDLERFTNVNDSLGWPAGDSLLRQVAEWLTRHEGDAGLTARVGANHFAIVVADTQGEADVARRLEGMLSAFREHPFRLGDSEYRISFNAGAALYPTDGADADTLFRNAEAALKRAKAGGDRYLFYTQAMTDAVAGALALENRLRQALKHHEFVLHYQPLANLASGRITGAEALIRWNDPSTGLVLPDRFIPILEETGLIHDVGEWALQTAVDDYLRWRAAGFAVGRIAVNVSPLQLRRPAFVEQIAHAVSIDPGAAAGLELEITESVIMADVAHSITCLRAIRDLGVRIAVDDFGTGFSSLSYLSRLPVDTLKIDHSFVRDMTTGPEGLALVSTVVSLAHSLKLTVVAEGVETDEQAWLLRDLGCDEMQGYLFSRPVPADVFEARFLAPRLGTGHVLPVAAPE